MKLTQLFESKKGWAADMAAENRERQRKEREAAKAEEKARKAANKAAKPKKPEKVPLDAIYHKALDIIGSAFPDADPIDRLGPWMEKNGLTMADVDRAFKKNGDGSYDRYLVDMWDQHADQAMYDAEIDIKKGKEPDHYHQTFVRYDHKTKKLTKLPNPWK
jgi:hypothetical protein